MEMNDEESLIANRLREKHAVLLRVAGFPRPHSEPCLSRQCGSELENEAQPGSTSAPISPALSEECSESGDTDDIAEQDLQTETKCEAQGDSAKDAEFPDIKCAGEGDDVLMGSENTELNRGVAEIPLNSTTGADFLIEGTGGAPSNFPEQGENVKVLKYNVLVDEDDMFHLSENPDAPPTASEPINHSLSIEDQLNAEFMGAPLDTLRFNEPISTVEDDFDFSQSIEAIVETRHQEQKKISSVQPPVGVPEGACESSSEAGNDLDELGVDFNSEGVVAIRVNHTTNELTSGDARSEPSSPDKQSGALQNQVTGSRSPKLRLFSQTRGRNIIPELRNKLQSISFPSRSRSQRQTQKRQISKEEGTGDGGGNHVLTEQKNRRRQCQTRIIEL